MIEAVPNFSEGRDPAVIGALARALGDTPGVRLLDVDPDATTNRTVMTLFGSPAAVAEALFRGVQVAVDRIDLRSHSGTHPRMGAADVLPLVPWDAEMRSCVDMARQLGERLGRELELPVYHYAAAASRPEHQLLADVRRGGFEGLPEKMADVPPDHGPSRPHPTAGASAVGARPLLVAWNVNLDTDNVTIARRVARAVREFRSLRKDADGRILERIPGRLRGLRAMGWAAPQYGCAQVTCNLVDLSVIRLEDAWAAIDEEARKLGARVTGSELVGMVPREALGPDLDATVELLGLDTVKPFDPEHKIIERALAREDA